MSSSPPESAAQVAQRTSRQDVWFLKEIIFGGTEASPPRRRVNIITQNFNGPCSFIAICNILILRGDIEILPPSRKSVSYELLSQLVADYLLRRVPDVDISAALSIMPLTQKGMDLNPVFTSASSFRPGGDGAGEGGGELKLFDQAGIKLYHGWLVDPDSPEAAAIGRISDYDSAAMLVAEADHLTKGQLLYNEGEGPVAGSSKSPTWSDDEKTKIEDAMAIRRFLDQTESHQITYHGLFHLASELEPDCLFALFRGSHLSVLYKSPHDGSLYGLVTDAVFLHERSIVWERMEDVDGGSTWVDSDFVKASPAGGDFAGQTAEDVLRATEAELGLVGIIDPVDEALAQQLQQEEQDRVRQEREAYNQKMELKRQEQEARERKEAEKKERKANKKKGDCIIM